MVRLLTVLLGQLWCLSLAVAGTPTGPLLVHFRRQLLERRNQNSSHRRNLQEQTSCQDLVDLEELLYGGECTCADESQAPSAYVVTCAFPGCEGESCAEDPGLGAICAALTETITYDADPSSGLYQETTYTGCIQYTSGRSDLLCYTEEEGFDLQFSCELQLNDLTCSSCDECIVDCTNIDGGDLIDSCSSFNLEISSDSPFFGFDDNFFAQCFGDDDYYYSDDATTPAPSSSMAPSPVAAPV
ncbi:hypothetical protein ACA910_003368 [Epithemia clementina (nom. ined.)]